MAASFEETLNDFDLSLFRQTPANEVPRNLDKRNQFARLKKKIIHTNQLLHTYHGSRDLITKQEKVIAAAKEECKQIAISYNNVSEKCAQYEKEIQHLQITKKELTERTSEYERRYAALQSHVIQLQTLVQNLEASIELNKSEVTQERNNVKDMKKNIIQLKKDRDMKNTHLTTLAQIVFGKRKLTKKFRLLFEKYLPPEKTSNVSDSGSCSGDEFDSMTSPFDSVSFEKHEKVNTMKMTKKEETVIEELEEDVSKTNISRDTSENEGEKIEIVSVDTGRGSSLSFSPEYYLNDSPLSEDDISKNEKRRFVDMSTITDVSSKDRATSPMLFINESNTKVKTRCSHRDVVDAAVSPIKSIAPRKITNNRATSPNQGTSNISSTEDRDDWEIELILNTMRLPSLITPIPFSPLMSSEIDNSRVSLSQSCNSPNIEKQQEDIKKLQSNTKLYRREIATFKNFIRNNSLNHEFDRYKNSILGNEEDDIIILENIDKVCPIRPLTYNANEEEAVIVGGLTIDNNTQSSEEAQMDISKKLQFEKEFECEVSEHALENKQKGSGCDNCKFHKRAGKLSRLDKLRNKMLPKSKIKNIASAPIRRRKGKHILPLKKLQPSQKRKEAYEKAVKVWTELNSKKKAIAKGLAEKNEARNPYSKNDLTDNNQSNHIDATSTHSLQKSPVPTKINSNSTPDKTVNSIVLEDGLQEICKKGTAIKKKTTKKTFDITTTRCKRILRSSKEADDSNDNTACRNESVILKEKVDYTTPTPQKRRSPRNCNQKLDYSGDSDQLIEGDLSRKNMDLQVENHRVFRDSHDYLGDDSGHRPYNHDKKSPLNIIKSGSNKNRKCFEKNSKNSPNKIDTKRNNSMTRKRKWSDNAELPAKRILRSSKQQITTGSLDVPGKSSVDSESLSQITEDVRVDQIKTYLNGTSNDLFMHRESNLATINNKIESVDGSKENNIMNVAKESSILNDVPNKTEWSADVILDYNDLDLFDENVTKTDERKHKIESNGNILEKLSNSILCRGIEEYGDQKVKNFTRKISDAVVETISKKLEEGITHILGLSVNKKVKAMNKLVGELCNWTKEEFIAGLILYLSDPTRKSEMYNKDNLHPAPAMTKSEQVLLYIMKMLKRVWPDVYDCLLNNIEFTLFRLNRTPAFETIESMSHIYAVICRYINNKCRLRLFLMSAMYCIQFKSFPLIKQCLEVWTHILPLAHMGVAKSPLVTCCIYLLHFYKCEDKFNRVQEIRNILSRTYFYRTSEWNETRILEMFKAAITELKGSPMDSKMLKLALIILAKRHGPRWCQNHIIQNMLKPLIEKRGVPERIKIFCVSVLGPLLKPYPVEMKVHCEIVMNELLDMLKNNPSPVMEEAIYSSLIFMSKHNQTRVIRALLFWCPRNVSADVKDLLRDFVKEKPVKVWKTVLYNLSLVE